MAVDEQARHRLHRKLEEVLGPDEAGILMDHLPPRGFGDLATKGDLELLRAATKSDIDGLRAATKFDIDALRTEVKADLDSLRREVKADIRSLRSEVKADMNALRTEVKADMNALRTEVKADMDVLQAEHGTLRHEITAQIERSVRRVIQWTSSTVLVGIGVSIAVSQLV